LKLGDRLEIGEVILEISKIGKECHSGCEIKKQAGFCVMPTDGVFARVIKDGEIRIGDEISFFVV
jgi:MOSC domain-containing protein YiiM